MASTTYYSAKELEVFRSKASAQQANPDEYPNGWSKSKIDPMKVIEAFSSLKIKKGFVLRAYQYISGCNGNGVVWAMPEDSIFPEPDKCHNLEKTALECPRPQEALEDIMEVVEGDGSDLSYIAASLFAREISEFGAIWHGCSWSSHHIIDDQFSSDEFTLEEMDDWDWSEEKPREWRPSVTKTNHNVIVNFYTYTGLAPAGIVRNTDTYAIGSYRFTSDSKRIMNSGGGYIY
jgi:hypothetical protein